jgi:RNA polymerase sigma-70 factor (ECF subfamily)
VETLPPRAREVFTLSRNEQLTNREIAERLALSPKTVEMHLTRALVSLRSVLRGWRNG